MKPWWVRDREMFWDQWILLFLEVLVSVMIAGFSLFVPTIVLDLWWQPMEGAVAWGMLAWFVGAFLITLGLFLRAHWKSLGGWKVDP